MLVSGLQLLSVGRRSWMIESTPGGSRKMPDESPSPQPIEIFHYPLPSDRADMDSNSRQVVKK